MTPANVVWIRVEAIMKRALIDHTRGRGACPIGWRCLVGCGLTILTGCVAQPSASTDPLDVPKTSPGTSMDLRAGSAPAAAQPGLSGRESNQFAALNTFGAVQAGTDRPKAPDVMNDPFAARPIRAANLVPPSDAWRRPAGGAEGSQRQPAVQAELARMSELPSEQLEQLEALKEPGQRVLRRSINNMTFGLPDYLDQVAGGREVIEAELARTREAGAQAAAAWLENRRDRISTMDFGDGRVVFGFKGSTNPAEPSGGPGLSADLGELEHLPAKVSVGADFGRETPGLAAFSDSVEAAEAFAREQQQTFGLAGEPVVSGFDPDAAGRLRVAIADRDGGDVKWWLSAGVEQDSSLGTQPVDELAGEQPMEIDAGVQYDFGPELAVSAAYGYRGRPDSRMDGLKTPAAAQGADEELHSASLRLIWRFITPAERAKTGRADGE
jgi:hypothetical protein